MGHKTLVGGTAYDAIGGRTLVGGTGYDIAKGRTLVGGTGYDIIFGIPLGSLEPGTIVYLRESGSSVPFYVAKHDYESGLNGAGRTLLVRKNGYDKRAWSSTTNGEYSTSTISTWMNSTYKALLDSAVQTAIGSTTFYYTKASNKTLTTLSRSIFLLSYAEIGSPSSSVTVTKEGSVLPIASTLQKFNYNEQWLRSLTSSGSAEVFCRHWYSDYSGSEGVDVNSIRPYSNAYSRPCFTLPASTLVAPETYLITG